MSSLPKPIIGFNPPVYNCKRATKPFVLDGKLDKDFWSDAQFTEEFIDIEGETMPKPRFSTRAKMLWDDENLYIGAELFGDEIWGYVSKRDDVIFADNDFEIFIDPDSDTHEYYEFEMNALNTVWDLMLTKPYRDGGSAINAWDIQGLQTAVHIEGELNNPSANNKRWSVEVVMPFEVLKQASCTKKVPALGEFYRMNFSRVQWKTEVVDGAFKKLTGATGTPLPEDNWVWAPTGVINIHYPELWAFVFFTENGEEYAIPDDEYTKWELRKLYYMQCNYYGENGSFCTDFSKLKGDYTFNISPLIEVTKNNFEISCKSKDNKRSLSIFADGKVTVY